ncbi:MAG: diguanylate cyclase, partial [Desulfobulbaceae bacterium]|nr:diguanylate cyclase [Candidatus Desulfatifera sulfidica]
ADAFDAMTTNRIYKPRKEIGAALAELSELSGSQFHPATVQAALKVLQDIRPPSTITQLPETDLEKRRFSYFFNDKLTGLYNEDYLQILLQNNREGFEFHCLHSLHLKNLQDYNKRKGWEAGDQLCLSFANYLSKRYPDSMLFRAYGNDFVIVSREHQTINLSDVEQASCLQAAKIEILIHHLDLARDTTYLIKKLEQLELITAP